MSTKKLSRTVIEGGRYRGNKWERYQSNAELRAAERNYLKEVTADPELAYEEEIEVRQHVYKSFRDKLNPMYRWLNAQVGRPWSEVRSEVFQKFDTRTTAGRHITFDHLLREVVDTSSGFDNHGFMANPSIELLKERKGYWIVSDYYVDQEGVLRKPSIDRKAWRNRKGYLYQVISDEEYKVAEKWLNNRMIIEQGGKYYWALPTEDIWMATWFEPFKAYDRYTPHQLVYYVRMTGNHKEIHSKPDPLYRGRFIDFSVQTSRDYWEMVENPYSFRQRGELSSSELKTFKSFKKKIRLDILDYGKGR